MTNTVKWLLSALSVLVLCAACATSGGDDTTGALRCEDTNCEARHRVCIEATETSYASCGECVADTYEFGGACHLLTTCKSDEYEKAPPTANTDRECVRYSPVCVLGSFESEGPTATSDRVCTACPAEHYCAGGTTAPEYCRLSTTHHDPTLACDRIVDIALGSAHACILTQHGEITCWGDGADGQLVPHPELASAIYLSASSQQTCAVDTEGRARCWGRYDDHDAIDPSDSSYKTKPSSHQNYTAVEAGSSHVCALAQNGAASCWGYNANYEAEVPMSQRFQRLLLGTYHSCGENMDGEIICWGALGGNNERKPPEDLAEVVSISTDQHHTCATDPDGHVRCWGGTISAAAIEVPDDLGYVVSVKAGSRHTCALDEHGEVTCWGHSGLSDADVTAVPQLPRITQIGAGGNFACAIDETDGVTCWGDDRYGQISSVPSFLRP